MDCTHCHNCGAAFGPFVGQHFCNQTFGRFNHLCACNNPLRDAINALTARVAVLEERTGALAPEVTPTQTQCNVLRTIVGSTGNLPHVAVSVQCTRDYGHPGAHVHQTSNNTRVVWQPGE